MNGIFGKKEKLITAALAVLSCSSLAIASYATAALFTDKLDNDATYPGVIDLRSYFEKGTGTLTDPFVISRPMHFYNLTRLQNLGVFGDQYYFSLGFDPTHPDKPYGLGSDSDIDKLDKSSLKFYPDNTTKTTADMISYLNMSANDPVLSIGSEGSPFYGIFNGNSKEIYGLKVKSGPEDVGVFGYTYSGSIVKNVYFNDLSITDDGYDNKVSYLPNLYGDATPIANTGSLSYTNASGTVTSFDDVTSASYRSQTALSDTTGHFTYTLPSNPSSWAATYEVRSSSEYFTVAKASGGAIRISLNTSTDPNDTTVVTNNQKFIAADGAVLSSRFSLVARLYRNGVFYSKVLKTYKIELHNTLTGGTPAYAITLSGGLDYVNTVASGETGYVTGASEYAHGVNIGYLIGHCDGTASQCFVFGGSLNMNTSSASSVIKQAQETETGLIGEIGPAIDNAFTPQESLANSGDTGVVDFSQMYSDIVGTGSFSAFGSYFKYTPAAGTSSLYLKYLRNDPASSTYFSKETTSVDFTGRRLIKDRTDEDFNLGVFSLVTSDVQSDTASTAYNGVGEFAVKKDTAFTEFYYSTAEWADPSLSTYPAPEANADSWSYALTYENTHKAPSTQLNYRHINLGYYLPSYTLSNPWNPLREKYFNYLFRCPLKSDADLSGTQLAGLNYFANTNCEFLKKYFEYKLIDKNGDSIAPGSTDFGVFVKHVASGSTSPTNITSFDASLKLTTPSAVSSSGSDGDQYNNDKVRTITYTAGVDSDSEIDGMPARTINFKIESANGANVTVMASSPSGSGGYVGVYDKATVLTSTNNAEGAYANRRPSYAMYVPYTDTSTNFAYFDYNYLDGSVTNPATFVQAGGGNLLYAHTFKLPKGEYFIGSPNGNVYIYYVCAQGQEGQGNAGNGKSVYSALNKIEKVDFISQSSTASGFSIDSDRCYLSFKANFSNISGSINVLSNKSGSINSSSISTPANLQNILIYNKNGNPLTFNGATTNDKFLQWSRS